jgi:hypothetical protein
MDPPSFLNEGGHGRDDQPVAAGEGVEADVDEARLDMTCA